MLDRNAVEKLIRESVERNKQGRREYHIFGKTLVSVKKDVFSNIDFNQVISEIEENMPPHLIER